MASNSTDFDREIDGEELSPQETKDVLRTYEDDILGGLLAAAGYRENEEEIHPVEIVRNGVLCIKFRIRPLSESEYNKCKEKYTKYVRNKQWGIRIPEKTDTERYRSALIYEATVKEDRENIWDNKVAWRRLDVLTAVDLIDRVLKSGEKDAVLDLIDKISGYTSVEEDTVKN